MMNEVDVLVIGAGPSGTVASTYLANQGYNVMVVEKTSFPRYVIGESLLPLSMEHFEEVGLLPALEEQNFLVKEGALFIKDGKEFLISFDDNFTKGWTWTWQVPRRQFDKALADAAENKGVNIKYLSTLNSIDFEEKEAVNFEVNTQTGVEKFKCKYVIDSSGYGGVLTNMLDIPKHISPTSNMATYVKLKDDTRKKWDNPTQISFEILEIDLWLWVIPFHNGNTSLGFVGNQKYFDEFLKEDSDISKAFNNMFDRSIKFKERFKDREYLWEPRVHKDYMRSSEKFFGDRFVLTGNTTEFLDPVFSSGVAFATESGLKAAKLVEKELNAKKVDWQKEYVEHLEYGIDVFRTYVKEWYSGDLQKIFFHSNINPLMKKQLTSVLAGYVWDKENPFVRKHKTIINTLAQVVDIEKMKA
ncbi:tryptophan 7-halogenase [Flavobacteriales bacterium]|nr:tryptophan 7-halogenase [Flavobacteriales bacterium]